MTIHNSQPYPILNYLEYISMINKLKYHIEYILPILNAVCYIIRSIKPYMSVNTLRIVYCSRFNSIINYGSPFWRNSPNSIKIVKMQKNIIRIMLGCKKRVSCRNVFRKFKILTLASQYILFLFL